MVTLICERATTYGPILSTYVFIPEYISFTVQLWHSGWLYKSLTIWKHKKRKRSCCVCNGTESTNTAVWQNFKEHHLLLNLWTLEAADRLVLSCCPNIKQWHNQSGDATGFEGSDCPVLLPQDQGFRTEQHPLLHRRNYRPSKRCQTVSPELHPKFAEEIVCILMPSIQMKVGGITTCRCITDFAWNLIEMNSHWSHFQWNMLYKYTYVWTKTSKKCHAKSISIKRNPVDLDLQ